MNDQDQRKQPSVVTDQQLPLKVIVPSVDLLTDSSRQSAKKRALPKYFLLAFVPLLLFTGAVVGIYVQPPGLRAFLRVTGLQPGGGTSTLSQFQSSKSLQNSQVDQRFEVW